MPDVIGKAAAQCLLEEINRWGAGLDPPTDSDSSFTMQGGRGGSMRGLLYSCNSGTTYAVVPPPNTCMRNP